MKKFKSELRAEISTLAKQVLNSAKDDVMKMATVELAVIEEERKKIVELKERMEGMYAK